MSLCHGSSRSPKTREYRAGRHQRLLHLRARIERGRADAEEPFGARSGTPRSNMQASGRIQQPTRRRRSTSVATAHVSRHCDRRLPGSQTLAGRPVLGVVNSSARGSDAAVQARSCVANLRMSRTHRASHRDPFRPGTLKVLHVRRHQVILPSCHQESQQKRLARLPGENGPSRGFEARTPGRPKGQALSPGADRNVCGRQREQLLTK